MATLVTILSTHLIETETRTNLNNNFTALNNELATMLPKAGGTMSGAINMNNNAITNIPAGTITTATINDLAVTTAKIADSNVTTVKIANNNVTTAKLEYKEYVALASQAATSAPAVTVVKNTLSGTPTPTRSNTGTYIFTLTDEFVADKTTVHITNGAIAGIFLGVRTTVHDFTIYTFDAAGTLADSLMVGATIIVRVYP